MAFSRIQLRTIGGTAGFVFAGILSWILFVDSWHTSLPLGFFYAVLTFNTYFSIRLFSGIIPSHIIQTAVDWILSIVYLLLAVSLGSIWWSALLSLLLFVFAVAKYALALNVTAHPKLLKRKILVDLSGVMAAALFFVGVESGYPLVSAWAFAIAFAIANVIIFTVYPLYRADS